MKTVINASTLNDIYKTFSVAFSKGMESAAKIEKFLRVEDIGMTMNVTGSSTTHSWLAQLKGMTEWVGARVIKMLEIGQLTVVNRDFEDTVSVPRNAIEDDQVGIYSRLVQALDQSSEEIWDDLMLEAVSGNANWADGNPFFCSGRLLGDATITNAGTDALSKANVEAYIAAIEGFTLHSGRKAKVRCKYLIVGPSNEATAKEICEAAIIANTAGTAGISNVSPARSLQVKVNEDFTGTKANHWIVAGEKAGIPLVAVQKRKSPELERMDDPSNEYVFLNNEFLYGTHARGEAFLTLPFLAKKGGLSSVSAWSQAAADTALANASR